MPKLSISYLQCVCFCKYETLQFFTNFVQMKYAQNRKNLPVSFRRDYYGDFLDVMLPRFSNHFLQSPMVLAMFNLVLLRFPWVFPLFTILGFALFTSNCSNVHNAITVNSTLKNLRHSSSSLYCSRCSGSFNVFQFLSIFSKRFYKWIFQKLW